VELVEDLNYERRKRQRTVSPEVQIGQDGAAENHTQDVQAGDQAENNNTLPWDPQLRIEAEKCAEAESDTVVTKENEGESEPILPTKHFATEKHDPAAQLLKEVEALEQARRSSTPKSVFAGTRWASEKPEQPTNETSTPSSRLKLPSLCPTI
jgi:hypothetical protein